MYNVHAVNSGRSVDVVCQNVSNIVIIRLSYYVRGQGVPFLRHHVYVVSHLFAARCGQFIKTRLEFVIVRRGFLTLIPHRIHCKCHYTREVQ